jgi:hypothetical protein
MKSKDTTSRQSDGVKLWTKADSWTVAAVLIGLIITLANAA